MNTNVTEFLKEAVNFQDFAAKRGYEMLEALGCKWNMYTTPDKFEFELDGVVMTFTENISDPAYADHETVSLQIEQLELNEREWNAFLHKTKQETLRKEEAKNKKEEEWKREEKERQFNTLKKELGY